MSERSCPTCDQTIPQAAEACPRCVFDLALEPSASVDETLPLPPPPLGLPSAEELSRRLPGLRVLRSIGQGGMGAVFLGEQEKLGREVAIKVMAPELGRDPDFQSRFAREARALARLSHPNIVGVYDFGQVGDLLYLVMEYVDGVNLRRALKAGALAPEKALAIVPEICAALCYAHEQGVIHRDIKPENLLLDKAGRVKIADFGLAKLVDQDQASGLTKSGYVMGTPSYMAPEQREKPLEVDHRADIYSLGVVFYEMLTGELPIGRFAPPSKKSRVDKRLDDVVFKALEREPDDRFQTARDLRTELFTMEASGTGRARRSFLMKGAAVLAPLIIGMAALGAKLWPGEAVPEPARRAAAPPRAARDVPRDEVERLAKAAFEGRGAEIFEAWRRAPWEGEILEKEGGVRFTLYVAALAGGQGELARALKEKGISGDGAGDLRGVHGAAVSGDLELLKSLISEGADVHAVSSGGKTALHFAAIGGDAEMIRYLIDEHALDPAVVSEDGETPLFCYFGAKRGEGRAWELLYRKEVGGAVTSGGESALLRAVKCNNLPAARRLAADHPELVDQARFGAETPLRAAVAYRHFPLVKALIPYFNAAAERDKDPGQTMLHLALQVGELEIIKLVARHSGAAAAARDNDGRTLLGMALESGKPEVVQALIEAGIPDTPDDSGRTAFHRACRENWRSVIGALLRGNSSYGADNAGVTPLMEAAQAGEGEVIARLRGWEDRGKRLDLDARDERGETALIKAAGGGHLEAARGLLQPLAAGEPGADPSRRDRRGLSALDHALAAGAATTAEALVAALADRGAPDAEIYSYRLWRGLRALEQGRLVDARRILEPLTKSPPAALGALPVGGLALKTAAGSYSIPGDPRAVAFLCLAAFAKAAEEEERVIGRDLVTYLKETSGSEPRTQLFSRRQPHRVERFAIDQGRFLKLVKSGPGSDLERLDDALMLTVRESGDSEERYIRGLFPRL